MTPEQLSDLIHSQYAELPAFLKEGKHKARGEFQLRIQVQELLPTELSQKQIERLMTQADEEIALLLGLEPQKPTHIESVPTAPVKPSAQEQEKNLITLMENRLLRVFEGTSDGTLEGANAKASLAKATLKTFLAEHCPSSRPWLWAQRARLRAKGLAMIEAARQEDIYPLN